MPTFREDLHLGHEVPTTDTDDIVNRAITEEKLADDAVSTRTIQDKAVTEPKLDDDAVSTRTIQDEAVTTPKIADKAVTPGKLSDRIVPEVIDPLLQPLKDKDADLQNQIDSLQIHGLAVSNEFGSDQHIGISQKRLTLSLNEIYALLEEALGRTLLGFTWEVTPTYIHGEWPTEVHISAQPTNDGEVLESVKLYVNNELVDEVTEPANTYSFDIDLQETADIRMEAQVLGVVYQRTQRVNHYCSFWLGAATSYASIMDEAHQVPLSAGEHVVKDITAASGNNIIIVIGESIRDLFLRADINGVEIPFTETSATIDGKAYKVLTSENTYQAGTYNIDING